MKTEVNAVMLFIAELTGSFVPGSGTVKTKIACGQQDYISNNLHTVDLNDEEDRKELHENIWLERLYDELDHYFKIPDCANKRMVRALSVDTSISYREEGYKWTVPLELDASASMLQYMGILLGDKRLMEMTNVIGDTLQDPWKLEGMSRAMLKTAATPQLYGSSQACHTLWQDGGMNYTAEDVALYQEEMKDGAFGVANLLKEFIINNSAPKATMKVKIWNEEFEISCNRFRNVGEKTKAYKIWDSIDKQYNIVLHTDTKRVPDLEQFKRYFMTLLIHNLDSQVADTVSGKLAEKYGWIIPIHDAFLISPAAAMDCRQWYAEELAKIYRDRKQILRDYFTSIGITSAALDQWATLRSKIVPLDGDIEINPMALK